MPNKINSPAPQPSTAQQLVDNFPAMIAQSLLDRIRRAYEIKEQVLIDYPIFLGPNDPFLSGTLRWHLVEKVIFEDVSRGLIPGSVKWEETGNSQLHYLDYRYNEYSVTFASTQKLNTMPKRSEYRIKRAEEMSQLTFFEKLDPASTINEDSKCIKLVMLHGHKNLDFAQLALLGSENGEQVVQAFGRNLFDDGLHVGVDIPPVEPVAPAAVEQVERSKLQLVREKKRAKE